MSLSEVGLRTWWITESGKPAIYRIAAGGLITAVGSEMTAIAFGFFLYDRTGSAFWLSVWYFLSFGITGVLTPVFGWLADRFDRRRLIIFSDLAAAGCSLTLIAAHDPVALVAVAFLASIVGRVGSPSFAAAMPNLAGEERLEWANGTLGVAFNIGRLVGPVAGGALYVVAGRSVVFAVDAATYLVAAASIWSLLIPFRAAEAEADAGEGKEEAVETSSGVFRGFAIVFADPAFRALVLIWAAGYFAVDIVLVGELPLARALGAGALAFGVLEAAWGGGSILGSLFGRKLREEQDVLGISIGVVGIVVGWGLIALSPWFIPIVLLSGMVAVASGVEDVAAFSMIQRSAADDVRGRVFSTFQTSGLIANAIAFAIAGVIVDTFGPRSVFMLGAVMSALCIPLLRPLARRRAVGTEVVPPTT